MLHPSSMLTPLAISASQFFSSYTLLCLFSSHLLLLTSPSSCSLRCIPPSTCWLRAVIKTGSMLCCVTLDSMLCCQTSSTHEQDGFLSGVVPHFHSLSGAIWRCILSSSPSRLAGLLSRFSPFRCHYPLWLRTLLQELTSPSSMLLPFQFPSSPFLLLSQGGSHALRPSPGSNLMLTTLVFASPGSFWLRGWEAWWPS